VAQVGGYLLTLATDVDPDANVRFCNGSIGVVKDLTTVTLSNLQEYPIMKGTVSLASGGISFVTEMGETFSLDPTPDGGQTGTLRGQVSGQALDWDCHFVLVGAPH
jgi:hypothetical protein